MNLRNNNDNAQPKSVKSAKSVVENTFESKKENSDEIDLGDSKLKTKGADGEKLVTKRGMIKSKW